MTPSSAMEARSRSAEVSVHMPCQGNLGGLGGEAQTEAARRHFLVSLCLSLPICEIEIATVPIL